MKFNRLLLPALLILSSQIFAQTVYLRSGSIQPTENLRKEVIDSFNTSAKRIGGQAFAVIQFNHIPSIAEQKLLLVNGITLLEYLPENTYRVSIKGNAPLAVLQSTGSKSLFQLSPKQKMQDYFARGVIPVWAVKTAGTVDVWISFPKTLNASDVISELRKLNVDVISEKNVSYNILALQIAANRISEIASLSFVEYIQPAPPKDQPLNYNSRVGSRATILNSSIADGGKGLNGEGVTIGVGDNADIQEHVDFRSRFINRNPYGFNAHGVHVAGTAAGAGNIDERLRGYAPKATIVSQGFNGIIENVPAYVNDYDMVITNNSYGNVIECEYHGTYDLYSRVLDQQALDYPNLLNIFSSGNSGGNVCAPYSQGYHTVLGSYQTAKNVITVGATFDNGDVALFSSKGPVKDGRIKPEIIAMGAGVVSTWPTNTYSINFGTSMSAPGVTGGLALLYQRYRQIKGGANPKNGLMKAILCNGAADKGVAGPDFQNGFGWMNLWRSLKAVEDSTYFTGNSVSGGTNTHLVTVPANTAQLKVLLYWNDLPASVITTKNLVNDLDLEVTTPTPATLYPRILDTANANLNNNTVITGADHVNNIEQVVINSPAAGTYTFTIKGTTVTNAQQEYFVAYDVIPVGIKLTSPAGGDNLLPGETAKISWDAHGLTGTANLEFSSNGGATWSPVSGGTNVDVLNGIFPWTVPSVTTNNALVRITKNGTGETSVSNPFIIVDLPVISLASVQCEGYISINWNAIAGVTDYEVMLLRGDDMKPVVTTTSTSYIFSGLSKDSVYWFTVRPRVSGKPGRRAYALSRQPNDGTCSGTISDNDLKIDAIIAPTTGRLYTSTQLSASQPVTIRVKNLDDAAVNSFTVSYSVNGASVTENVTTPIAAGATYTHTFAATADLSLAGTYNIIVSVKNIPDAVTVNDSVAIVVKQIDNQPLNLATSFIDNLESAATATYLKDTMGFTGADRYDFSRTTVYGRARTFVNSGIAYSGSKAITLDADRNYGGVNTSYLYGTFNLDNYDTTVNDLRLDFQYLNHGQLPNGANRVWIRGNDTQPWIQVYNLDSELQDAGQYKKTESIEIGNILAANLQNFTPGFGVRWGQAGQYQATDRQTAAGLTFDDIRVYQVFNDLQMIKVDSPTVNSCGLNANTKVQVSIRNASSTTLTNIPVSYRINGGALVTETISSIPAKTTIQYLFTTLGDFSTSGANTLQVYAAYGSDSFRENDTVTITINNQPIISSFPYLQNFETNNGNFYAGGKKSSWQYGTPGSREINSAASGAKAWKTGLNGNYNDNEFSYLYSPCFNLSGITAPTLSFSVALDIEDCGGTVCDGAWVEYSTDGETWTKLGIAGTGTNWYNKTGDQLWSIQNYTHWHVATQALPTGVSRLLLRFVMVSDPGVTREGVAIDDIHVYDNTQGIYDGVTMASPVTQNVSGNSWINFSNGGKLVASVQPSNATLGNTDVQAYIHTGAVRFTTNQYYHNRNITIKPANNTLPDSVSVRFYFLDNETEALLNATGCGSCVPPESAYVLGVSKYTDATKTNENGTIADNGGGTWNFISSPQVTKVPFDKGYYAEFKTAGFSEFWLSTGGLGNLNPLPVGLLDFTASKQGSDVFVQWKITNETSVARYEIEVAKGNTALSNNSFIKIGEVASLGNTSGTRQYSFSDLEQGKTGARYYRLKTVNLDGSFTYSDIKAVMFGDAVLWQVYPNPSSGKFNLVYQLNANEIITGKLYDAKGSLVKDYRTIANGFLQKLNIDISANNYASGVYLLRINAGTAEQVFRLYKQ
jgi:hypothetical protein